MHIFFTHIHMYTFIHGHIATIYVHINIIPQDCHNVNSRWKDMEGHGTTKAVFHTIHFYY